MPNPKRKGLSSKHQSSGAMLVSGRGILHIYIYVYLFYTYLEPKWLEKANPLGGLKLYKIEDKQIPGMYIYIYYIVYIYIYRSFLKDWNPGTRNAWWCVVFRRKDRGNSGSIPRYFAGKSCLGLACRKKTITQTWAMKHTFFDILIYIYNI